MSDKLPKYDDPPVVETVLGVQFDPLQGYTAAHAGWFWRQYLSDGWPTVLETHPIPEQFERFGEDEQWEPKQLRFSHGLPSPRIQFVSQDQERMIQVQNNRFHYNWRKRDRLYQNYNNSVQAFEETWQNFIVFCGEAIASGPRPNQWEITYINHIAKDSLWSAVSDWPVVFPDISMPASKIEELEAAGLSANWRMNIGEAGRLHITLEHVRVIGAEEQEAIRLTLTARGPISDRLDTSLRNGLDLGHSLIVRVFTGMTSTTAHQYWKRRQ